ncbi:hypothetical protein [Herpetosiphon geysericola]|uniref:Uncharacterized protein n=1 Tax=Herpetosiphon geysericola TaxID=70996 RepID=A0A0P6XRS5_9CHLR|nr:hypothetical protein [Herpetosiphon geysericola]KPL85344.1 hypothetical protein SE18_16920 [Herpetosiphon geysericola]
MQILVWLSFSVGLLGLAWYNLAYFVAWRRTKSSVWLWYAIMGWLPVGFFVVAGLNWLPRFPLHLQFVLACAPLFLALIQGFHSLRGQVTSGFRDSLDLILLRHPSTYPSQNLASNAVFVPAIHDHVTWANVSMARRLMALGCLLAGVSLALFNAYQLIQTIR